MHPSLDLVWSTPQHVCFPPGYLSLRNPVNFDNDGPGWGWAARCLAQMEQGVLYSSINLSLGIEYPANLTSRSTTLSGFLCPSDATRLDRFSVVDSTTTSTTVGAAICEVTSSNYVGSVGTGDPSSLYPCIIDDDDQPPGRDNGNGMCFRKAVHGSNCNSVVAMFPWLPQVGEVVSSAF